MILPLQLGFPAGIIYWPNHSWELGCPIKKNKDISTLNINDNLLILIQFGIAESLVSPQFSPCSCGGWIRTLDQGILKGEVSLYH